MECIERLSTPIKVGTNNLHYEIPSGSIEAPSMLQEECIKLLTHNNFQCIVGCIVHEVSKTSMHHNTQTILVFLWWCTHVSWMHLSQGLKTQLIHNNASYLLECIIDNVVYDSILFWEHHTHGDLCMVLTLILLNLMSIKHRV